MNNKNISESNELNGRINSMKMLQSFAIGLASGSISLILYIHSQSSDTDLSFYLSIFSVLLGSVISLNWSNRSSSIAGFTLSVIALFLGLGGYAYWWNERVDARFIDSKHISVLEEEYDEGDSRDLLRAYIMNSSDVNVGEVKIMVEYLVKDSVIHRLSKVIQQNIPKKEAREIELDCGNVSKLNNRLGIDGIKVSVICAHQDAGMHCQNTEK